MGEGGSCRDLRGMQNINNIESAFSALVSGGKMGYKTVIERRTDLPKCSKCGKFADAEEKFCSECGGKIVCMLTKCPSCSKPIKESDKFCTGCGTKIVQPC